MRGNEAFAYSHHKRLVEEMLADYRRDHPQLKQVVFRVGTILGETTRNQITAKAASMISSSENQLSGYQPQCSCRKPAMKLDVAVVENTRKSFSACRARVSSDGVAVSLRGGGLIAPALHGFVVGDQRAASSIRSRRDTCHRKRVQISRR